MWKDTPTGWHLVCYMPILKWEFPWFTSETGWPCTPAQETIFFLPFKSHSSASAASNRRRFWFAIILHVTLPTNLPASGEQQKETVSNFPWKPPEGAEGEYRKWVWVTAAEKIKAEAIVMAGLSEVCGVFYIKRRTLTSTKGFFFLPLINIFPACTQRVLVQEPRWRFCCFTLPYCGGCDKSDWFAWICILIQP